MNKHFTIGMAGHIDHGKTTLTKALTGVDTDRLKEEKERQISIELGYAPLRLEDDFVISIIDVPGHERFIRQMIAGISGIDLVILVVAADEGVMPQTSEHLEIVKFLNVQKGIVAITKKDKVDLEMLDLVKEEIVDELQGSVFHDAPVIFVDSVKNNGIGELLDHIKSQMESVQIKQQTGNFRLPIDQVFTLKGHGTIVRGTIVEGAVQSGDTIELLPKGMRLKARQLQVHNEQVNIAAAGQRVAINISNSNKNEIRRGDVLVYPATYETTNTIDAALRFVKNLKNPIKQRGNVKVHIGTSEVLGKIVFFDRNELSESQDEVLCQLRLEEPIVAKRGDKLIVRRPSPAETIGGGWVIQPKGKKYKFGKETMEMLENHKQGSPMERMEEYFLKSILLSKESLDSELGLKQSEIKELEEKDILINISGNMYTSRTKIIELGQELVKLIIDYHCNYPLRTGIQKAELVSIFTARIPKEIVEYIIESLIKSATVTRKENILFLSNFQPHFPNQWKKRMEQVTASLKRDKLTPNAFGQYSKDAGLPEKEAAELRYFLVSQGKAFVLDDKHLVWADAYRQAIQKLKALNSNELVLGEIKEELNLSRKYLIPFVELMDELGITKRVESKRVWK